MPIDMIVTIAVLLPLMLLAAILLAAVREAGRPVRGTHAGAPAQAAFLQESQAG